MDAKAEKIALFRYGLIAPLVLEPLPRGELSRDNCGLMAAGQVWRFSMKRESCR
jgi:hypothetical protein